MRPVGAVLIVAAMLAALALFLVSVTGEFQSTGKEIEANCTVLTVLLDARADRDATVKLFASIRARDPKLFDRLVARAELGDRKLLRASEDLSCDLPARVHRKLQD